LGILGQEGLLRRGGEGLGKGKYPEGAAPAYLKGGTYWDYVPKGLLLLQELRGTTRFSPTIYACKEMGTGIREKRLRKGGKGEGFGVGL